MFLEFITRMKKLTKIIAVFLFFLLFFNTCYAQTQETQERTLKLAITNFKKIGGTDRYNILLRAMPELLALNLIENRKINYVERGVFWKTAMQLNYLPQQLQENPDLIFENNILNELNIDLLLEGSCIIYRGKVRFECLLRNVRGDKKPVTISSNQIDINNIFLGIKQFAEEVESEIATFETKAEGEKVAFLCFKDISPEPSDSNKWLGHEIPIALISNIHTEKEIIKLPWRRTKIFCGHDHESDTSILEQLGADLLIKGRFSIEGDNLTIYPILYMKTANKLIELSPVEGNLKNIIQIKKFDLSKYIGNVLGAIISGEIGLEGDGALDSSIKLFVTDDPTLCLEKGKENFEKGNLFLAELYFEKVIKIAPNDEVLYLLGLLKTKQKHYDKALKAFNDAIAINKNCSNAYKGLGDLYFHNKKYNKALKEYKKANNIDSELENIHYKLGITHYFLGDEENAIIELDIAKRESPDNLKTYQLLVAIYIKQNKIEKAEDVFMEAVGVNKESKITDDIFDPIHNYYFEEGMMFIGLEDYANAEKSFKRINNLQPSISTYKWLMLIANNQKDYEKSISFFNEAESLNLEEEQGLSVLYNNKGYALLELHKYKEAIEAYDVAIDIDPKNVDAYDGKASALVKINYYKDAVKSFDKVIYLAPKYINAYKGKGYALEMLEHYERANNVYDDAIRINSKNADIYNLKGKLLEKLELYDDAKIAYTKAIKIDSRYFDAYANKINLLLQSMNYAEALDVCDEAISLGSNNLNVYINKCHALVLMGRIKEAKETYNTAYERFPEFAEADDNIIYIYKQVENGSESVIRGYAFYSIGHYEAAKEAYDEAIRTNSEYVDAYNLKGKSLEKLDLYEDALNAYDTAIKIDPKYYNAYVNKAYLLLQIKNHEDALKAYDEVININPNDIEAYNNKGYVLIQLERYNEAIKVYNEGIRRIPGFKKAYKCKDHAYALIQLGQYEEVVVKRYNEAIELYDKAIIIYPEYANAYYVKGNALAGLGSYDESLAVYNNAIEIDSKYLEAYNGKGDVLRELSRYENAINAYNKAIEIDPKYLEAYSGKADALRKLYRYDDAISTYNNVIKINSEYFEAYYGKGIAFEEKGSGEDYEKALSAYNKAIEINSKSANALKSKGDVLYKQGNYEKAKIAYDKAIEFNPKNEYAYYGKGKSLEKMKDYNEAITVYNNVITISHNNARGYYNLSRIYSQKGISVTALINFKKAIEIDETFLQKAIIEKDFDPIRDDPAFIKLIETK
jgi:tetratricopeptide (TPR) repeat protein